MSGGSKADTTLPEHMIPAFPILVVAEAEDDTAVARSSDRIGDCLRARDFQLVVTTTLEDGYTSVTSDPSFCCVVLSWGLCAADLDKGLELMNLIERRTKGLPILLVMSRGDQSKVPLAFIEHIDGFIWLPEDSPDFIAGRIEASARRYLNSILPPFFGAMVNFQDDHAYSWHTPGHTGGTAYMKTAVGRTFLEFYGEQMFRSDLSVSVGQLGSLNDHSGPVAEAERNAARVYGADYTYFVVGGSSASNCIILHSAVADDVVLVDRNCHKSLNYALNMSGSVPIYLMPKRNARGLIGPVPRSEMTPRAIKAKVKESPLVDDKKLLPVLAALTNSTYDGLCYNVETTTAELSKTVPRIHYDEAWYAYARFNPVYEGRYGMHRGARSPADATVTVTHSTHKCLAALSQASMIHIRSGKVPVNPSLFNEAFMMHTSTSPQYSLIASTDVSAKMMDDAGEYLTDESIGEAISFRQAMVRLAREIEARKKGDWWFGVWQPDKVGSKAFADVDPAVLRSSGEPWVLRPGASWHGFGDIEDGYCMLDPIKVTVLTPGLDAAGKLGKSGIPAPLVSSFLDSRGIVVEKTEPYSFLMLFTVGVTKGKWGSMVAGLMEFKRAYDANTPLTESFPGLVANHPEVYGEMGLRDLADRMHEEMKSSKLLDVMDEAFTILPDAVLSPRESYSHLVKGQVEKIPVAEMLDRIAAVQLVPYPPGIPIMMPGERVSEDKRAIVDYLVALQAFDSRFPGFEHHVHGVAIEQDADGKPLYTTYCLTE